MSGRGGAIEQLFKHNADVKAVTKERCGGYAPLHVAADAGQCGAVTALITAGSPVDIPSAKGLTPLYLALVKVGLFSLTACV